MTGFDRWGRKGDVDSSNPMPLRIAPEPRERAPRIHDGGTAHAILDHPRRRNLRQALAEALCRESAKRANGESSCMGVLEKTMDRLNDILAGTFPGQSVVVKDQVLGYRRKKDMFVLLVEVFGPDDSVRLGPYVVKIGPAERIEREIQGWDCCRPPGLRNDLVFLELEEGLHDLRPALDEPGLRRRPAVPGSHAHRAVRDRGARDGADRIPADPLGLPRDRGAVRADRIPALQPGLRGRPGPGGFRAGPVPARQHARPLDHRSVLPGRPARREHPGEERSVPVPGPDRLPELPPGIRSLDSHQVGRFASENRRRRRVGTCRIS